MKHMADELQDCINRTQIYYIKKIESSFKSSCSDINDNEAFFRL